MNFKQNYGYYLNKRLESYPKAHLERCPIYMKYLMISKYAQMYTFKHAIGSSYRLTHDDVFPHQYFSTNGSLVDKQSYYIEFNNGFTALLIQLNSDKRIDLYYSIVKQLFKLYYPFIKYNIYQGDQHLFFRRYIETFLQGTSIEIREDRQYNIAYTIHSIKDLITKEKVKYIYDYFKFFDKDTHENIFPYGFFCYQYEDDFNNIDIHDHRHQLTEKYINRFSEYQMMMQILKKIQIIEEKSIQELIQEISDSIPLNERIYISMKPSNTEQIPSPIYSIKFNKSFNMKIKFPTRLTYHRAIVDKCKTPFDEYYWNEDKIEKIKNGVGYKIKNYLEVQKYCLQNFQKSQIVKIFKWMIDDYENL